MFEIKNLMCEDKNLSKVLRALDGLVVIGFVPVPVNDAALKKGKVVSTNPDGLTLVDKVANALVQGSFDTLTSAQGRVLVEQAGGKASSWAGIAASLVKAKVLKKAKGRPGYDVLQKGL